jgi:hypothetical protein
VEQEKILQCLSKVGSWFDCVKKWCKNLKAFADYHDNKKNKIASQSMCFKDSKDIG